MYTKLTLRIDSKIIEQAKQYAEEHGSSLSQLVTEYFAVLTAKDEDTEAFERKLPPITRSLVGVLKESEYDPKDYQRYLEDKYV
jgi:hypothetical protein